MFAPVDKAECNGANSFKVLLESCATSNEAANSLEVQKQARTLLMLPQTIDFCGYQTEVRRSAGCTTLAAGLQQRHVQILCLSLLFPCAAMPDVLLSLQVCSRDTFVCRASLCFFPVPLCWKYCTHCRSAVKTHSNPVPLFATSLPLLPRCRWMWVGMRVWTPATVMSRPPLRCVRSKYIYICAHRPPNTLIEK